MLHFLKIIKMTTMKIHSNPPVLYYGFKMSLLKLKLVQSLIIFLQCKRFNKNKKLVKARNMNSLQETIIISAKGKVFYFVIHKVCSIHYLCFHELSQLCLLNKYYAQYLMRKLLILMCSV